MTTEKAPVMTVKEFLALSDRERDATVAEKVMRFAEVVRGSVDYYIDRFGPLPHYTTSIGDAWKVVDQIKALPKPANAMEHARVSVTVTETADFSACSVEMWFNTYYHREGPGKAPLVICIAALLAVGALREGDE